MSLAVPPIEELDTLPAAAFEEALAPLFEGGPALLRRLSSDRPFGSWWNLLNRARVVAHALPEADQIELLNAHPRLGAPPDTVSAASFEEQGYGTADGAGAQGSLPGPGSLPTPSAHVPASPPAQAVSRWASGQPAGLRSRMESRPAAAEPPVWGSSASAGAAPKPPSAAAESAPRILERAVPEPSAGGDSTGGRLARLNDAYEDWFGFRYCVFVAGRPLESLTPELEAAMSRPRHEELRRGVDAVIDIAIARSGAAR